MNKNIYRQGDSRWRSLPYPTKAYSFGGNGCGACSVLHCIIEQEKYKDWTPKNIQPYMKQFATKGHGTLWAGIKTALEHYGYKVHWRQSDSMADIYKVLKNSLKRGVILFGSTKGPDKTVWTTGGHYIAFVDYKIENGKHYFYLKDSGGRHHDKWWQYERSMAGDVRQVFICTGYAEDPQPTPPSPTPTPETYTGKWPTKTIKRGSSGTDVKRWQNFLKWLGYDLQADGKFGAVTLKKTKDCQEKWLGFSGKEVDGIVGPKTITKAKTVKKNDKPTATEKCIDVSYWQGKINQANWEKVKKTCGYAICRASYTSQDSFTLHKDSTFADNFVNAKAAGLKVGAYHYSQAITVAEAEAEAEYLCRILKDFTPTFYVVCDFEFGGRLNSKIGTKASAIANAFCSVVEKNGYKPCIYANTSTLNKYLTKPAYPVWVAQYNTECTYKGNKVMWQYTSSGKVDGINGKVDLSYVYETPNDTPLKSPVSEPKYTGGIPSLTVKKNSAQVISDALKWGRWIAATNDFHYGEYGHRTYKTKDGGKYLPIYNVTHSCGCPFCGTEKRKKMTKADKLGYNGENWRFTYVCNTFATAMFAHGGQEATTLSKCQKGGAAGMDGKGKSPALEASKNWQNCGKLPIKDLKAGDILVSTSHMQTVYSPVSASQVKIIEATSYIGKYHSKASDNSIRIIKKKPSYTTVYRFVGSVNREIPLKYGEYSDRVKQWQDILNFLGYNCGKADGIFGLKTLEATDEFQKKNGLKVDGIVGKNSLAKAEALIK